MLRKWTLFITTFVLIVVVISIVTFSPYDSGHIIVDANIKVENWMGIVGGYLSTILFTLFGQSAYFFILLFILVYFSFFFKVLWGARLKKFIGLCLFILTISYFNVMLTGNASFIGGGVLAGGVHYFIKVSTGVIGEWILLIILTLVSIDLIFGINLRGMFFSLGWFTIFHKQVNTWFKQGLVTKPPLFQKLAVVGGNNSTVNITVRYGGASQGGSFYSKHNDITEEDNLYSLVEIDKDIVEADYIYKDILYKEYIKVNRLCNEVGKASNSSNISTTDKLGKPDTVVLGDGKLTGYNNTADNLGDADNLDGNDTNVLGNDKLADYDNTTDNLDSNDTNVLGNDKLADYDNTTDNLDSNDTNVLGNDKLADYDNTTDNLDSNDTNVLGNDKLADYDNTTDNLDGNGTIILDNDNNLVNHNDIPIAGNSHDSNLVVLNSGKLVSGDDYIPNYPELEVESSEKETSFKLENTLNDFGIDARVVHVTRGPVVTRYELIISAGIKVSKIVSLQDNLALSLAASKIRIIAPIPGKSAVGVEVPNKHREVVTLDDLVNSKEYRSQDYSLPIILGKGISGTPLVVDLSSMPHLLIAGSTGSGKSVFVNALISSILLSKGPSDVRFLMIDPKRVELKLYDEIPHLIAPVITEAKKAVVVLKWAVNEMEERYILLERYNCRDIKSYNKKVAEFKIKHPNYVVDLPLEYLVVIVDEFADLMMVCGKDVESYVSRLAAMARAVGIHLVLATQRPSVDVITGLIKANFPARVAFQVSSKTESRIILDCNGAEKLLGKGDFLFSAPGLGDNKRVQGVFLGDEEVYEITSQLKSRGMPNYIPELEAIEDADGNTTFTIADEPLFREAVEIILADRKVSASYLQRKMRIGYNRAARLVELLEQEGIVGTSRGSRPRDILIESYEF